MEISAGRGEKVRVLVIEDEVMVAMLTEDMLTDLGFEVVATASSVEKALQHVEEGHFDVALLDVNLRGEKVFPVADELIRRQLPFAFTTGYGVDGIREDLRDVPIAAKPFSSAELERKISAALNGTDRNLPTKL